MREIELDERTIYSTSELKSLGWSDAMIKEFLPYHDYESENPYFEHWANTKEYLVTRVRRIMATETWQKRKELAAVRSERAKYAAKKRLEAKISSKVYKDPYGRFTIKHGLTHRELLTQACKHSYLRVEERMNIMKSRHNRDSTQYGDVVLKYILDELVDIDMDHASTATQVDIYKALFKIYDVKNLKVKCLEKLVDHIHLN